MASNQAKSQALKAKKSKIRRESVGDLARRLNTRVERRIRSGFGSPGLLPVGLIVLETTGRRSGQVHRTPLLATVALGGYLWVSTVLGKRANWLRNAHANPEVRYWLRGRVHRGQALVSAPGYAMPDLNELPPLFRWGTTRALNSSRALGLGVVIIVPKALDSGRSA